MRVNQSKSIHLPLTHALAWIVGSTLFISGGAHLGLQYYLKHRSQSASQDLVVLMQTGPQKEALKTEYLAELLGLSADHPPSSPTFDMHAAEKKLISSPLIREAHLKLLGSHSLYVDYTVRQPIAWAYDYENTAIDTDGYLFPFHPFFSPKNLPEIYLGEELPVADWGKPVTGKSIQLAFALLHLLSDPKLSELFQVKRIDVSHAFAASCGQREIVVILEDTIGGRGDAQVVFPKILRLNTKTYAQELGNYLKLRTELVAQEQKEAQRTTLMRAPEKVIDLRISQLAFIDTGKKENPGS